MTSLRKSSSISPHVSSSSGDTNRFGSNEEPAGHSRHTGPEPGHPQRAARPSLLAPQLSLPPTTLISPHVTVSETRIDCMGLEIGSLLGHREHVAVLAGVQPQTAEPITCRIPQASSPSTDSSSAPAPLHSTFSSKMAVALGWPPSGQIGHH
jgi:hypothetical protein